MTDEQDITRRSGTKLLKTFPVDEPLVSMVEFKGTLYIASTKSVFKLVEDEFHQLEFVLLPPDEDPKYVGERCPHERLWDDCPDCRH